MVETELGALLSVVERWRGDVCGMFGLVQDFLRGFGDH